MTATLTRDVLGFLEARSDAPIAGISSAWALGNWTAGSNVTLSIVSSRLRLTHAAAAAAASRYARWTSVGVLASVHLQFVLHDSDTLVRSGLITRATTEAALPDDMVFGRMPNEHATGGNRAVALVERENAANTQLDSSGTFTPAGPQRIHVHVDGTEARLWCPGLPATRSLSGVALVAAGYIGIISSNDSASSSTTQEWKEGYAAKHRVLTVNGPAFDSWYVAILDASDVELATAAAAAGVAEVDFEAEGILYPEARKIEIRAVADDAVLIAVDCATLLDSRALWGGDEWTFAGEVPPETPNLPTLNSLVGRKVIVCTDPVDGATSYKLLRGDSESGPFVQVASGTVPCLADTAPLAEETYFYVMRACNGAGCSGVSEALEVETTIAPCTLELEAYEADGVTVAWRVSTDAGLPNPYLDRPTNYGAREIDPVRGAAIISTVSVSVRDVAQTPGDQDTGFVTERLSGIYGRRFRLLRHTSPLVDPVVVADGPATKPRMAADYSSYAWEIRDTRDTERKLQPFRDAGTLSLFPFGPVNDWGQLSGVTPIVARCDHSVGGGFVAVTLVPNVGVVFADTLNEEQRHAVKTPLVAGAPQGLGLCDVLWRPNGSGDPWNQIFPAIVAVAPVSIAEFNDDGECASVSLALVLDGFPVLLDNLPAHNDVVEFFIRYRGAPTTALPAHFEGALGELLQAFYDRTLEQPAATGGLIYDLFDLAPAPLSDLLPVRYDAAALAALTEPVLLRQTQKIEDGRAWAESRLYAPSGWIPALDGDGRISPVSRTPSGPPLTPEITGTISQPSPEWNAGERIVSGIEFTSHRYFLPTDPVVERGTDGVATRGVTKRIIDTESQDRHGEHMESFDATAFAFVGDSDGEAVTLGGETVDDLLAAAEISVLDRYKLGAPAVQLMVRRDQIAAFREGDFVSADLPWLPGDAATRGLAWAMAQILMIGEDDCAWRTLLIERCPDEGS